MRTNTDFAIEFKSLRATAKDNGLDPNTWEMRAFLVQIAEVMAQEHAEAREAMNRLHTLMK